MDFELVTFAVAVVLSVISEGALRALAASRFRDTADTSGDRHEHAIALAPRAERALGQGEQRETAEPVEGPGHERLEAIGRRSAALARAPVDA